MTDIIFIIFNLAMALIAIVQERFMFFNMDWLARKNERKNIVVFLCSAFNIIWPVCAVVIGMSILTFLTGMFVCFSISLVPFYREHFVWVRFCQMKFLFYTAVVLILLGTVCLFGTDIQHVSSVREVRLFVLLGAKTAELIYIIFYKNLFKDKFKSLERDKKKVGMFQGFLWSCMLYIYIDGVLAIFDFGSDFVPALMISGNILILTLMFMFYRFDYIMEQKEYLGKEHQQLVEEKARELWKAEQFKSMAEKDTLTSAYSRRYAVEKTKSFKEENIPFLIIYVDIDKMKEINDTRGHQAGDIYLKNFVSSFSCKLRAGDFIARIGGDEFLVILKRCNAKDGERRMEEISRLMPEYSFSYGISAEGQDVEAMIEEADKKMYSLKKQKSGRSTV